MRYLLFLLPLTLFAAVTNSTSEQVDRYLSIKEPRDIYYTPSMIEGMEKGLQQQEDKLRVVSFNMLFYLRDAALEPIHRWPQRKERVLEMIRHLDADLIGSQELQIDQVEEVLYALKENYAFVGKPYMYKSGYLGEVNGIFYKKSRFDLLDSHIEYTISTRYPGKKTITKLVLLDKQTKKKIVHINSHLAFRPADEREMMTLTMIEMAKEHPNDAVVITGDFNYFEHRPDLATLPSLDGTHNRLLFTKAGFTNAQDAALFGHIGPISTFTNDPSLGSVEPFKGTGTPGINLDHIFINDNVSVLIHGTETGQVNGEFPSDHLPIFSDIILK